MGSFRVERRIRFMIADCFLSGALRFMDRSGALLFMIAPCFLEVSRKYVLSIMLALLLVGFWLDLSDVIPAGLGLISSLCRRADLPCQEQVCLRQEGPSWGVNLRPPAPPPSSCIPLMPSRASCIQSMSSKDLKINHASKQSALTGVCTTHTGTGT